MTRIKVNCDDQNPEARTASMSVLLLLAEPRMSATQRLRKAENNRTFSHLVHLPGRMDTRVRAHKILYVTTEILLKLHMCICNMLTIIL